MWKTFQIAGWLITFTSNYPRFKGAVSRRNPKNDAFDINFEVKVDMFNEQKDDVLHRYTMSTYPRDTHIFHYVRNLPEVELLDKITVVDSYGYQRYYVFRKTALKWCQNRLEELLYRCMSKERLETCGNRTGTDYYSTIWPIIHRKIGKAAVPVCSDWTKVGVVTKLSN